nr:vegetative cell wall protein gp1-like [Aegilops tauschii subsp. strangulata]
MSASASDTSTAAATSLRPMRGRHVAFPATSANQRPPPHLRPAPSSPAAGPRVPVLRAAATRGRCPARLPAPRHRRASPVPRQCPPPPSCPPPVATNPATRAPRLPLLPAPSIPRTPPPRRSAPPPVISFGGARWTAPPRQPAGSPPRRASGPELPPTSLPPVAAPPPAVAGSLPSRRSCRIGEWDEIHHFPDPNSLAPPDTGQTRPVHKHNGYTPLPSEAAPDASLSCSVQPRVCCRPQRSIVRGHNGPPSCSPHWCISSLPRSCLAPNRVPAAATASTPPRRTCSLLWLRRSAACAVSECELRLPAHPPSGIAGHLRPPPSTPGPAAPALQCRRLPPAPPRPSGSTSTRTASSPRHASGLLGLALADSAPGRLPDRRLALSPAAPASGCAPRAPVGSSPPPGPHLRLLFRACHPQAGPSLPRRLRSRAGLPFAVSAVRLPAECRLPAPRAPAQGALALPRWPTVLAPRRLRPDDWPPHPASAQGRLPCAA